MIWNDIHITRIRQLGLVPFYFERNTQQRKLYDIRLRISCWFSFLGTYLVLLANQNNYSYILHHDLLHTLVIPWQYVTWSIFFLEIPDAIAHNSSWQAYNWRWKKYIYFRMKCINRYIELLVRQMMTSHVITLRYHANAIDFQLLFWLFSFVLRFKKWLTKLFCQIASIFMLQWRCRLSYVNFTQTN